MKILISLNSSSNLINFRYSLIQKLIDDKHKLIIVLPKDKNYLNTNELNINAKFIYIKIKRNSFGIINNLFLLFNYYKIIFFNKPHVALFYTIKPNIFGSLAALFIFRKLNVFNFITGLGTFYFETNFKKKIIIFLYKLSFIKSKKIIFQNNDDQKFFVENKILNYNKTIVISGSGVDTKKYKYNLIKNNTKSFEFLCVSRLIKQKGIIELLDAAKMIKYEFPHINFTIIGSIDHENKSVLSDNDYNELTKFINHIDYSDNVYEHIIKCDCFVLPSYREGTSMSLLEAASVGRPIITTDVPGCNNIVKNNYNGYLCKPKSSISLYKSLKKMIKTQYDIRVNMSQNSRLLAESIFDINIVNHKIIKEIYNDK